MGVAPRSDATNENGRDASIPAFRPQGAAAGFDPRVRL